MTARSTSSPQLVDYLCAVALLIVKDWYRPLSVKHQIRPKQDKNTLYLNSESLPARQHHASGGGSCRVIRDGTGLIFDAANVNALFMLNAMACFNGWIGLTLAFAQKLSIVLIAMPVIMINRWLDSDGGLKPETTEKIQELSKSEDSVLVQHPHWKGSFSIDDMTFEDLQAISIACLENDSDLKGLYDKLVPGIVSQTTFWTSYLSHVEYFLKIDQEGEAGGRESDANLETAEIILSEDKEKENDENSHSSSNEKKNSNLKAGVATTTTATTTTSITSLGSGIRKEEIARRESSVTSSSGSLPSGDKLQLGVTAAANVLGDAKLAATTTASTNHKLGSATAPAVPTSGGAVNMDSMVDRMIADRLERKALEGAEKVKRKWRTNDIPAKYIRSETVTQTIVYCPVRATSGWICVWRAGVHVRVAPDIEAPTVASIPYGEAIAAIQEHGSWVQHRLGWSCTRIGNFTLLDEIPEVSTPYGPGFLCHNESTGISKVLLGAFGAECYIRQNYVKLRSKPVEKTIPNGTLPTNAHDISKLMHNAKADGTARQFLSDEDEEEDMPHTGLVIGLLQTVGVMDGDYGEEDEDEGESYE
eukprot:jgi/Bigna1/71092/fgenesh1_pg.14_\